MKHPDPPRARATAARMLAAAVALGVAGGARAETPAAPPAPDIFPGFGLLEDLPPDRPREPGAADAAPVTAAQERLYEGLLDIQDGKFEEGIPKLEWVLRADPSLLAAWESLGWAYWLTGRPEDTRRLWERLLALAPGEPLGYNLMAQLYTREGDLARAGELYRRSLELDPDQYETRFSLARVVLWSGERVEAARRLRELYREDPDRIDVEIDLAWALFANEEYEEAADRWTRICATIPDYPDYMAARAQALLYAGALDEAQDEARRILEIEENHLGALNLLADVAERAGRPEDAIDTLRRILEMATEDDVRAMIARRIAALKKTFHDRDPERFPLRSVLAAAREAMDLDPEDIQGVLFYAETLVLDKQYAAAADLFLEILENWNPHNLRARQGLLETYFGRNLLDLAEKQLRSNLLDFNPHDPYRHVYWARLHFARGRFEDAMRALDRLEEDGAQGAVFTLLYHGLSPSEFTEMMSVRQFRDQLLSLRRAGFRFITPDEFDPYFAGRRPPEAPERLPALARLAAALRRAWTGERPPEKETLRDFSPDLVACITFDDGLRTSFRAATPVAEDLGLRMAMHIAVGLVLSNDVYVASWPEIREALKTGVWEIGSHLMDASLRFPVDAEGAAALQVQSYGLPPSRSVTPLPNRIWLPEAGRLETMREYSRRVRREFRDSREILIRELGLEPEDAGYVAYVEGDLGQEAGTNIEFFHVPEMLLNEAEIHYRMGFIQSAHGYAMQADHPMLYQRYEPSRHVTGREVMLQAFRSHPVFLARRLRAEMAALQGRLHLALRSLDQLRRDGYPEELLQDLSEYVHRRLARQLPVPAGATEDDTRHRPAWVEPHGLHLGVEGSATKANVLLEERRAAARAGLYLNRRVGIEGRIGFGRIEQQVVSNVFYEVDLDTVRYSRQIVVNIDEAGRRTRTEQLIKSFESAVVTTNRVERRDYSAEEEFWGVRLNAFTERGSLLILDLWHRQFDGDLEGKEIWGYAAEFQWRPQLGLDMAFRFQHDMVPSARDKIDYDAGILNAVWRPRDEWHAQGRASYSLYSDDNSMLALSVENLWLVSPRQDVWLGLHHSVTTSDRGNDLYWTPYWDQRHYLVGRIRRSYPNSFGLLQLHLGWQKEKARPETREEYNQLRARAELQGFYPGDNPDAGWAPLLGIGASLRRQWANGFEVSVDLTVNALREYTERNLFGTLLFRF